MQVKEHRVAQGEEGRRGESRGLQTRQLNKAVKGERRVCSRRLGDGRFCPRVNIMDHGRGSQS